MLKYRNKYLNGVKPHENSELKRILEIDVEFRVPVNTDAYYTTKGTQWLKSGE